MVPSPIIYRHILQGSGYPTHLACGTWEGDTSYRAVPAIRPHLRGRLLQVLEDAATHWSWHKSQLAWYLTVMQ